MCVFVRVFTGAASTRTHALSPADTRTRKNQRQIRFRLSLLSSGKRQLDSRHVATRARNTNGCTCTHCRATTFFEDFFVLLSTWEHLLLLLCPLSSSFTNGHTSARTCTLMDCPPSFFDCILSQSPSLVGSDMCAREMLLKN